jgi:hypothetical protein
MFGRRSLMMGAVAAATTASFVGQAAAQAGRPMLVFVGDQTSEDCKIWRTQWEPIFVASPVYQKLDYRVIFPEKSSMLAKQQTWPADLRWILDVFLMSQVGVQEGFEVPRFFLVQNKQVTFSTSGNSGWREVMWPTLQDVTSGQPG